MSNRLPLLLAVCLLFLISSCKKNVIPTASSEPAAINKVNVNNLDFTYFTSRAKMQFEDKNQKLSSTINIRMKQDSAIWVSVTPAAGIEVVRALITKDSVQVINRLQREYIATDFAYLAKKFNVDINFEMVQALLLGNYLPAQPGKETLLAEAPMQHLRQLRNKLIVDHFIDLQQYKLQKLEITDADSKNTVRVDYQDFEILGDTPFAKTLNVLMQQKDDANEAVKVNITHNKTSVSETNLSFPFTIPEGYERK
ncbi:MAG: DUF4292 domain-containing protein [Hymenobacteraceae bacterium]|nr:DUF4292 domain-containing protein [Hymenobacteraceae bacterium]MDX5394797.1 DUF4292 domain-containing protein [Hymenobacteraceae bacterium]MDX5444062.1 DUF4292 domain-containing protein [Hymenobacteraceae bacterium]MDX5510827.1 DUF4292 domain-containing protein [Hymenobacteraceae bacterium]